MFLIAPLVLAATLAAGTDATTTGYTGATPIRIASCAVQPDVNYYNYGGGNTPLYLPEDIGNRLNIKFSNSSSKQVSSVTFAVSDGNGKATNVVDSGNFSPGITIAHSFESPVSLTDRLGCTVSAITFSDGSMWAGPIADAGMK